MYKVDLTWYNIVVSEEYPLQRDSVTDDFHF